MIDLLKKSKTLIFVAISLFLYLFGYRKAKETAENHQMKGELNALKKASQVRASLSDTHRVKRLHDKYKR